MSPGILVILGFVINGIGSSIWPLMPFIAADLGFNVAQASFLQTEVYFTKIIFLFAVLAIARKVQNKYLVWGSVFVVLFSYLLMSFASSYLILIIIFGILGLALTFYGPLLLAEIAMLSRHGNRGRVTSNFSVAGELGKLTLSTILSFAAIYIGWRFSLLGATLILIPVMFFIWYKSRHFVTPETDKLLAAKDTISNIFSNKKVVAGVFCAFIDNFASSMLGVFLPFLVLSLTNNANYIPLTAGAMLLGAISGKFLMGRVADSKSPALIFIICELTMAVLTLTIGITNNITMIVVITFMLGIFTKGTVPVYQVMIAKAADKDSKYKSSSALMVLGNNLGALIAGWLFGFIGQTFGVQTVFIGFSIAALLATLSGLYYHHLNKHEALLT